MPLTLLVVLLMGAPGATQEPVASTRDVLRLIARVDRVDRLGRTLTLRAENGLIHTVYVDPKLTLFDELKSGDTVRVRIMESVVVAVRPNAKPSAVADTTAAAKDAGGGRGTDVLQQLKATVTIESVDMETQMVMYKDGNRRTVARYVIDRRLLEGLKQGDVVEVTYTRARAIELERER
jgi:Cu/Ag efflux protein CusF